MTPYVIQQGMARRVAVVLASISLFFRHADMDASWDVRAPVLQLTVPAGEPASLICREPPPGKKGWYRKRANVFPSQIKNTNRTTIDSDGKLHFSFVHGHDTGSFECGVSVMSSGSVVFGSTVNMTVKTSTGEVMDRKPKVMFQSGTIKSELGEDVQLECIFSGRPIPKISWTHSDKTIKSRGRVLVSHGFVVIRNVTEADHGVYTCTGENIAGSESSSATLDVSLTSSTDVSAILGAVKVAIPVVVFIVMVLSGFILGLAIWRKKRTEKKQENGLSTVQIREIEDFVVKHDRD